MEQPGQKQGRATKDAEAEGVTKAGARDSTTLQGFDVGSYPMGMAPVQARAAA